MVKSHLGTPYMIGLVSFINSDYRVFHLVERPLLLPSKDDSVWLDPQCRSGHTRWVFLIAFEPNVGEPGCRVGSLIRKSQATHLLL